MSESNVKSASSLSILKDVSSYYGEVLLTSEDLQTSACCSAEALPDYIKPIVASLDDEIVAKFYGCGSPLPFCLEGQTVLDLGCGSGRDVYVISKLVGEHGRVIGVDMTEKQLEVARRHQQSQAEAFGYNKSNVEFKKGYIENLDVLGIGDESIDVVVSNCVLNLSPEKEALFSEIFRVLKPGGELYFSDVFSTSRVPEPLQADPVLRGECLSGAMYIEDFRRSLISLGCPDYRTVSSTPLAVTSRAIADKLGNLEFISATVRAFKLASLEDRCEDYGQVATYLGTIPESNHSFVLDDHHRFLAGKPMLVCGNTASMLSETRFASHFKVEGNRDRHFGLFDCSDESFLVSKSIEGSCC